MNQSYAGLMYVGVGEHGGEGRFEGRGFLEEGGGEGDLAKWDLGFGFSRASKPWMSWLQTELSENLNSNMAVQIRSTSSATV